MAEANIQHEDIAQEDINNEKQHKCSITDSQAETAGNYSVGDDNTDLEQRNTENSKEKQNIGIIPAEKPIVYRSYGAVIVKPLALRKQYWSNQDSKDGFADTAGSSDVGRENIKLGQCKNYATGDNWFKRQDIHAATTRNPAIKQTGDKSAVAGDNTEQDINHDVATENSDINQSICDAVADKITDCNIDSVPKPELCQSAEESIGIGQRNCYTEEENENETISDIQVENPSVNHNSNDQDSYVSEENTVQGQDLRIVAEENPSENQAVSNDRAENVTADDSDEAVGEHPEDNHNNLEAEESRDENEENHEAAAAENIDGDQNNDAQNEPTSEDGPQSKENDEDKTTGDTTEKKTEKEAWTQEEIQALLRKAINLHASMKDLRTVIGCGGDVNKPIQSGLYPLHYAAYSDYPECINLLINTGANVNVTDDIGYTPLHLAARRGNHKSLEVLVENGAIINYSEPGVEIHQTEEKNKLGYTTMEPINLAVQNGHPKCARLLLEHGAKPDNKYFMGYEICLAPLDNPECMELLLEFGADPNVFNRCGLSPLMKACKDHHIEAVRKLIKYGADVNAVCPPLFEQKSVLQFAIISGNIVIINILLGKGAKIARQGEYKYSAIHTAVVKGRADICRLLLQHGADANDRTDEGATPMMLACSTPELIERREIVQLLLDCGADVNAHSPGYSYFDPYLAPLTEYFKCIGNTEGFSIVRLLIRNGAIIHFSSCGIDAELKRLRDPFSIVPYVHCLKNNQPLFDFVVSAATKYNPLIIYATENIPEDMKDSLIYTATRPRDLKHLVRSSLRSQLNPGLLDKVQHLPLPPLLKSYLLFR